MYTSCTLLRCYPTLPHFTLKVLAGFLKCRCIEVPCRKKILFVLVVCPYALVLEPVQRTVSTIVRVRIVDWQEGVVSGIAVNWDSTVLERITVKLQTVRSFGRLELPALIWWRSYSVLVEVLIAEIVQMQTHLWGSLFGQFLKIRQFPKLKCRYTFFFINFHTFQNDFLQLIRYLWADLSPL